MSFHDSDRPRRKSVALLFLGILLIAGLAAGAWYLRPRFESEAPQIVFKPDSDTVGRGPIEIVIADKGTGLKSKQMEVGLLDEAGVASIAGTSFGSYGEGYLRISYANSLDNIAEAIRRMHGFLEKRRKAAE